MRRVEELGNYALDKPDHNRGSIEGMLHTLSIKGELHFGIRDEQRKCDVTCEFGEEEMTLQQMTTFIGKRVSAWGVIEFGRHHIPKKIEVEKLRVLKTEEELPPIGHFAGLLKDV